ncbi:signal peptide peptidase SppA [Thermomonas haemolytica]|uniref:Protease-4 n=1 Tax=Thermomonas haemolytica TaxID=141949 RepID=A0A4R3MYD7_9GAMM|nr:signal peptide peptidase SppA [Thermomonas haemolytica]TCT21680.1 protease-4 [Thermomonas haemolytica]TNY30194.1 signal peptide peptidase SppA [Thermomonas haemolytica]
MTESRRRGPIARLIVGSWQALDFTRRLILNALFLLVLLILLLAMLGSGRLAPLQSRTTLVFAPQGRLVEQYSCDAFSRGLARATRSNDCREVRLRDALRALDAARTDARIERVAVSLDELQPSGFASLNAIAAKLAAIRAAGKQVIAYGDGYSQGQYLLAAQANEIYLDPMSSSGVMLDGLAAYRQYYREALQDKLGVDMHLFKVGTYKSAAEPYVLDAASPAAKEADLYWMGDVWQRLLSMIGRARGIDPALLQRYADTLPEQVVAARGDLAQLALQQKLVTALKTRDEVDDLLAERGVADADADGGFRQVGLDTYLQHLDGALPQADTRPQVAVVVAEGEIAGGNLPPGKIGGDSTSALLRQARDDDDVKAVVLRVSSPGGEVFASEQIRREVAALKDAGKPVVVSMGDVAASGGYWISMDADRIYADPSTITGSIGIFGLFPTIDRTLGKIGVHTDGVGTARYAGAFDITRPLDPGVAATVQAVIDKGYRDFTGKVAKARGKPIEQIDAVAQGRVWSGAQAKERGLVDAFGGLDEAIADAAARAKLGARERWQVRYVEPSTTSFSDWLGDFMQSRAGLALLRTSGAGDLLLASRLHALQQAAPLRFVQTALERRGPARVTALAYCFCEPR